MDYGWKKGIKSKPAHLETYDEMYNRFIEAPMEKYVGTSP
jgi:hypothetical protein